MKELSIDGQIDIIFKKIDDFCRSQKWKEIDDMLENVDVDNEPLEILVAYLLITLPARNKLNARSGLCRQVFHKLVYKDEETPHRIYRLLGRLI